MHLNRCNPHVFNRSLTALVGAGSASGCSSCQRSGGGGGDERGSSGHGTFCVPAHPTIRQFGLRTRSHSSRRPEVHSTGDQNNTQEKPRFPPSLPPPGASGKAASLSGGIHAAASMIRGPALPFSEARGREAGGVGFANGEKSSGGREARPPLLGYQPRNRQMAVSPPAAAGPGQPSCEELRAGRKGWGEREREMGRGME